MDHPLKVVADNALEQYPGPGLHNYICPDIHGKVDPAVLLPGGIGGHLGALGDLALKTTCIDLQSDVSHTTWWDGPIVADH